MNTRNKFFGFVSDLRETFLKGPSNEYSDLGWLQLVQWFKRRRLKCKMFTVADADLHEIMTIAHMTVR